MVSVVECIVVPLNAVGNHRKLWNRPRLASDTFESDHRRCQSVTGAHVDQLRGKPVVFWTRQPPEHDPAAVGLKRAVTPTSGLREIRYWREVTIHAVETDVNASLDELRAGNEYWTLRCLVRREVKQQRDCFNEQHPVTGSQRSSERRREQIHFLLHTPLSNLVDEFAAQFYDVVITAVGALAALGGVAKSYPSLTKEAIPAATSLLDAEDKRRRANAAGLLTGIADEYPSELQSVVPQATELLEDNDEKVRHNATSLLARVANEHPAAVEPATDALVARLDDDLAGTRLNAC